MSDLGPDAGPGDPSEPVERAPETPSAPSDTRLSSELEVVFSARAGFAVTLLDAELTLYDCVGSEQVTLGLSRPDEPVSDWTRKLNGEAQERLREAIVRALAGAPQTLNVMVGVNPFLVSLTARGDERVVALWQNVAQTSSLNRVLELMEVTGEVGGWELNCLTQQLWWTRETHRIFGRERDIEPPALPEWLMSLQDRSRAVLEEALLRCIQEGVEMDVEVECLGANHARSSVRVVARPVWVGGFVGRVVGSAQDVSERRRSEERTKAESLRALALMKSLPDPYLVLDFEGIVQEVHLPEGYAGLALPTDAVGRQLKVIFPNLGGYFLHEVQALTHGGKARPHELSLPTPDGRERRFEMRATLFDGGSGRGVRYALLFRDRTSAWERELELIHNRDSALQASKIKSNFLATMSHEIRTPLNGVLGMTELALLGELSAEQRDCLDAALQSGRSLLQIVDDILDLSKIEADRLELELIPFSLRQVVRECLTSVAVRAHTKGLELLGRVESELPLMVMGDPVRFKQILNNLLSNAVKFTDRGEVELEVGQRETDWVRVNVFDSGVGIPVDQQGQIFEAFIQADGSTTRRFGGTGLGLAICKQLVEKMEGQIWLESQPGQGSRFSLVVHLPRYSGLAETGPLANFKRDLGVRAEQMTDERAAALAAMRILVVDRNASNRRLLRMIFNSWGMEAATTGDADVALGQLREASRRRKPCHILLFEDRPEHAELSQFAEPEMLKMMMVQLGRSPVLEADRAGVSVLLTKPVLATELAEALVTGRGQLLPLIEAAVAAPAPPPPPPALNGDGARILLAEDNMINAKVVTRILESLGFAVVHAANGQLALDELERSPYDVCLMDVQMPVLDGLEATRRWRARESATGGHMMIIALTANAMMGDRERCLEHGMDYYLTKPIQRERLVEVLSQVRPSAAAPVLEVG